PRWGFRRVGSYSGGPACAEVTKPWTKIGRNRGKNLMRRSGFHLVPNDDAVTPRPFGLIQGSVCGSQHLLPTLAVIGKYGDAHRYRDGSDSPALVFDLEILHLPAELFGSLPDRSLLGRSHHQNELFAAIAGDDILAPRSGQHVLAYCTQHRVPRRVAERVVEALEVVDVDHHYAEGQGAAPGAALFPAERLLEVAAVMEAGQPVMYDLVLQAQVCLCQFPLRQYPLFYFLVQRRSHHFEPAVGLGDATTQLGG